MSVIDDLNELILEKYIITISSDSSLYEKDPTDEYAESRKDFIRSFDNESKTYTTDEEYLSYDLLKAIIDYVENNIGMPCDTDKVDEIIGDEPDPYSFWVTSAVDDRYDPPTASQIRSWEEGYIELYQRDTCISVTINGVMISNDMLYDLLFEDEEENSENP